MLWGAPSRRFSVGETAGFSLHAGVATKANERAKLERLCRYITRPAVSTKCLSLTRNGQVRYELKTPWRNGTTHVIFEPLDFMYRMYSMSRAHGCAGATISRLVALVPKPRINLTRFHGMFAPNSKYRALVTPVLNGNLGVPFERCPDGHQHLCVVGLLWPERRRRHRILAGIGLIAIGLPVYEYFLRRVGTVVPPALQRGD